MKRRSVLSSVVGAAVLPLVAHAAPMTTPSLRRLRLVNAHTGETFNGAYRDDNGALPSAMADLAIFLRDFHTDAVTQIDIGVLDFLASIIDAIDATTAVILSAYRTPETNAALARTLFGVAEHSQHLYGRALDVSFTSRLTDGVTAARAMKRGGVGWYPRSRFLHIDTGPVRNWDLEATGLDRLLLEGRTQNRQITTSLHPRGFGLNPDLELSGNLKPELLRSGTLAPELGRSGRSLR